MVLGKIFNKKKTFEQKTKDFLEHVSSLAPAQEEQKVKTEEVKEQKDKIGEKNEHRNAKKTKRKTRQTNK